MEKRYWYITPTDYERAAENGISKNTLWQRVRVLGWDVEKATKTPLKKVITIPQELLKEAEIKGVSRGTISARICKGWSIEKACKTETKSKGRPRVYPEWAYETAEKNGIKWKTVIYRIHKGWDLLRACTEVK